MVESLQGVEVYRLILSRYPTIRIFEDILDSDELDAAYALESMTNDRLREEAGDISLVPPKDRVVGPGASVVMAAFTHVDVPSRFSDGSYGVFYGGIGLAASLAEAVSSRERFMSKTSQPPCELTMRCYKVGICESLLDVRSEEFDDIYDPDNWLPAQAFGRKQRGAGVWGLWYRSVKLEGGECVAIFKPKAISPLAVPCAHYRFCWDGEQIEPVFKIDENLI